MSAFSSLESGSQLNSDFWKFWTGQTISTLGGSFTNFALPLLIFKLTGSALNLALSVTVTVLPYLLFGLIVGAWVDNVDRKRLMVITDLVRALVVASIPLVFFVGYLSVWWIYAVAFITSTLTIGFDAANFAAIPALVHQEKIVIANGRLQAGYSTAKVFGPLLAGLLILILPLPELLLIDAASFLISAGSLVLIHKSFNAVSNEESKQMSLSQVIGEGLRYILSHPVFRWMTLLLLLVNFILPTSTVQLVLFAKQWFSSSDTQIGLLYAGGGFGTVVFSLIAGRLRNRWSFGVLISGSLMLEGLLTAIPSITHWYLILLVMWILRSGADVLFMINTYSVAQITVPNQLLGRVITFIRVLTWSTASLGALLGGFAIEQTKNIALVYAMVGLLIFTIALVFFFTPLGRSSRGD